MGSPGQQTDPLLGHRFAVEIGGIVYASFTECSGLQASMEVFEYKEGGLNSRTLKFPGRTTFANITLKWGSTDSTDLWDWYLDVSTKKAVGAEKKAVSVIHYDATGQEVRRWNLSAAFPVKWVGPNLNSTNSAVAIETLELAFAEFELKT